MCNVQCKMRVGFACTCTSTSTLGLHGFWQVEKGESNNFWQTLYMLIPCITHTLHLNIITIHLLWSFQVVTRGFLTLFMHTHNLQPTTYSLLLFSCSLFVARFSAIPKFKSCEHENTHTHAWIPSYYMYTLSSRHYVLCTSYNIR